MRMHIGRKLTAFGLAAIVVGGATGTALAASSGSSGTQATASSIQTVGNAAQTTAQAKITVAQLAAKLGVPEKQLLVALAEAKAVAVKVDKTGAAADPILVKVLASDLQISGSTAEWIVGLIDSGALVTQ